MSRPKPGQFGTAATKLESSGQFDEKPVKEKPALDPSDLGPPVDASAIDAGEESRAEQRLARRQERVGHPGKLEGAAAESFVEAKLTTLSVDAVLEYEYLMKYGSNDQRERIAGRILDATGHGKKDRTGGSTQLIIVNGMAPGAPLPWAKAQSAIVTVEAPKTLPPSTP